MTASTKDARASTIKKTFSRQTAVSTTIKADVSIVWKLLTSAADFPRWNSTVVSMEGKIEKGEKIALKSTLDPKRTFKLKVKTFEPGSKLAWGDAMGTRVYTLQKTSDGNTLFHMYEKIGGPLFPLFAKMIPPFDQSFDQFAADLKKEAETISNTH